MRCLYPCGCDEDPCPHHGPKCTNTPLPLGLCAEHGCTKCGGVILVDTEDWDSPLCYDCWLDFMETNDEARVVLQELGS